MGCGTSSGSQRPRGTHGQGGCEKCIPECANPSTRLTAHGHALAGGVSTYNDWRGEVGQLAEALGPPHASFTVYTQMHDTNKSI